MRGTLKFLLGLCGLFFIAPAIGQEFLVSDPRIEMRENKIYIYYDILNSTRADEFSVELVVKDDRGRRIPASSLTGDVGDLVNGGAGKLITWNLGADGIEMNAHIHVSIQVEFIVPSPSVQPGQAESYKDPSPRKRKDGSDFSRSALILQSAALPGLGLSRYKGGPHWLKGLAGYACLTGSLVLNRKAYNSYHEVYDLTGYEEKNTLYQKALDQDLASEVLAYTAVAIWITDIIWTISGTRDLAKKNQAGALRIFPIYDPSSATPLICFQYTMNSR